MEQLKSVCRNPWCKATFFYTESEMIVVEGDSRNNKIDEALDDVKKVAPRECSKCRSFNNELSAGVTWTDKKYEGPRDDGRPHPFAYNVTRSTERRW